MLPDQEKISDQHKSKFGGAMGAGKERRKAERKKASKQERKQPSKQKETKGNKRKQKANKFCTMTTNHNSFPHLMCLLQPTLHHKSCPAFGSIPSQCLFLCVLFSSRGKCDLPSTPCHEHHATYALTRRQLFPGRVPDGVASSNVVSKAPNKT